MPTVDRQRTDTIPMPMPMPIDADNGSTDYRCANLLRFSVECRQRTAEDADGGPLSDLHLMFALCRD